MYQVSKVRVQKIVTRKGEEDASDSSRCLQEAPLIASQLTQEPAIMESRKHLLLHLPSRATKRLRAMQFREKNSRGETLFTLPPRRSPLRRYFIYYYYYYYYYYH